MSDRRAAVLAFIRELLEEKGRLPDANLLEQYRYLDSGHIDSLALIKFLFRIEDRFGIQFEPREIAGEAMRTVGGLTDLVTSKQR